VNSSHSTSDDRFAEELKGFGIPGIIAILLIILTGNIVLPNMVALPVGAMLVLIWVRLSHTPWCEIGYVKPRNWIVTLIAGFFFGIAFKFLMKAIVMPLLGADPVNHAYHFFAGNTAMLPAAIWSMFVAGFAEETVFRGYLFERLGKLFGHSIIAKTAIVVITSLLFGFGHYYNQGVAGVEQAIIVGLVYGTIFAATRSIWMIMIAHVAFDLTALAIIYWDIETDIAHLVFK
jgi:uncharacterized protein